MTSCNSLGKEVSTAAAAAKSLQSCPTLCNPKDGSPPGFPVPGILQARTYMCSRLLKYRFSSVQFSSVQSLMQLYNWNQHNGVNWLDFNLKNGWKFKKKLYSPFLFYELMFHSLRIFFIIQFNNFINRLKHFSTGYTVWVRWFYPKASITETCEFLQNYLGSTLIKE